MSMLRPLALSATALFLALPSCSGGAEGVVEMTAGQRFIAREVPIAPGGTVVFMNNSDESHTVTAYQDRIPEGAGYFSSGGFDTEDEARGSIADALIASGDTFEVTLTEPGVYEYFCIPHEDSGMKGAIVVEE